MSQQQAMEFLAQRSMKAHADQIQVPSLLITNRGDDQAPHLLIEPTIRRMLTAGQDVTVYTAKKSPHGFDWARTMSAARALRGEKTAEELAEEATARQKMIEFFTKNFARTNLPVVPSPTISTARSTLPVTPKATNLSLTRHEKNGDHAAQTAVAWEVTLSKHSK